MCSNIAEINQPLKNPDRYIDAQLIYYTGLSAIEVSETETTSVDGILVMGTGGLYERRKISYE